jgi:NSS family neurotransmitter:Na+ symporter
MLSVVAVASSVAIAEPVMSYLVERMRIKRPLAALLLGGTVWTLSLGCALSFNEWREKFWFQDLTLFELLELLSSTVLLPLACLLTALLVGYRIRLEILRAELYRESRYFVYLWRACLRYIAPPAIIVVMLLALIESL